MGSSSKSRTQNQNIDNRVAATDQAIAVGSGATVTIDDAAPEAFKTVENTSLAALDFARAGQETSLDFAGEIAGNLFGVVERSLSAQEAAGKQVVQAFSLANEQASSESFQAFGDLLKFGLPIAGVVAALYVLRK